MCVGSIQSSCHDNSPAIRHSAHVCAAYEMCGPTLPERVRLNSLAPAPAAESQCTVMMAWLRLQWRQMHFVIEFLRSDSSIMCA